MKDAQPVETSSAVQADGPTLARRLGPFDATMIVMGGIIGGGIFVNPSEVARRVHSSELALWAWAIGGAIALVGAFVYAELAAMRPRVGDNTHICATPIIQSLHSCTDGRCCSSCRPAAWPPRQSFSAGISRN